MEKSKNPQSEDENNRAETARKAQKEGHISFIDLTSIMAADESYTNILQLLREKFIPRFFIGPSNCDLSTHQGRFYYWMNLISRWAGLRADPIKKNLPRIGHLNCYSWDKLRQQFIIIDRNETKPDFLNQDHCINIDEFANYFKEIEYIYKIKLSLPKLLYLSPDKPFQQNIQDDKKVFPCESGTKWDQIEIALLPAGDRFMVKTPLGHGYYDHIDLKLHHHIAKSAKPISLWYFLKQLANMNGFFSIEGVQDFEKISSDAKRLNKHLKQLFGLNESIYKDRCDRADGYKTKFMITKIPDDNAMVNRKSLIDEELEHPKYSNIKEASYYPAHSIFKKE